MTYVRFLFIWLAIAGGVASLSSSQAQDDRSPDAAFNRLVQEAKAEAPANCAQTGIDRLTRILCNGRIRIGVREFYPLFATANGNTRQGYEIDVAQAIGKKLGVAVEFVRVNAASRIPLLSDDRIDFTIATMGHNTQRDGQVRFIRPHYYQSETAIVGPRSIKASNWTEVGTRTVCVTIGNGSNAEIVSQGARLMLFDEAGLLPERLRSETCTFAAQDDSFFAASFTDPAFAERFEQKFGFAQVPWGMAVAKTGSEKLARALELTSQIFHRDSVFLDIAQRNRIGTEFLEKQIAIWNRPACNSDTGSTNTSCVLPALNAEVKPTPFAGRVSAFEAWTLKNVGITITLPMFKTASAWSMFVDGIFNSLILIAGALVSTLTFTLLLGAADGSRNPLLHWPVHFLTVTLQSSPIVLTLVIAAAIAHSMFPYSDGLMLGAAIAALGLANGANAGQAIGEAMTTLRAERGGLAISDRTVFVRAIGRSATQIVAFLINAAKGSPVASFIGAPELLSALTDITSFSSGRVTTYWMLLIFYVLVVMVVVWLCGKLQVYLEKRIAA